MKNYISAEKYKAEIVICEYDTNCDNKTIDFMEEVKKQYLGKYSERAFCMKELPDDGFLIWGTAAWTKLYKLDFLLINRLQFQKIKSANDVYFTAMSMIFADSMIHTPSYVRRGVEKLVHYYQW